MKKERNFQLFLLLTTAALFIVYYQGEFCWDMAGFALYAGSFLAFIFGAVDTAGERACDILRYSVCFLLIFAIPVFSGNAYFGDIQMYVWAAALVLMRVLTMKKIRRGILPTVFLSAAAAAYLSVWERPQQREKFYGSRMNAGWETADAAVFIICMLPYILIAVKFFSSLCRGKNRGRYGVWGGLGLFLLPSAAVGGSPGMTAFALIFYYMGGFIAYLAIGDPKVEKAAAEWETAEKRVGPVALLLLIYPILLQPLGDFPISSLSGQILRFFTQQGRGI